MNAKNINILAIGRNPEIITVLDRLINNIWSGTAVTQDKEAMAIFRTKHFEIVLFSNGITDEEKAAMEEEMSALSPSVIFIQHMGGGSGLLENEIHAALEQNKK